MKLVHSGGIGTGYAHMSRIAVRSGERVKRGQVIGYVGSTGLSTGPHLHYEVYRGGRTVNPSSVKFAMTPQLSGGELRAFRAKLAALQSITNTPESAGGTKDAGAANKTADSKAASARIAMR